MKNISYIRITKADLAVIEDVSPSTLNRWMNVKHYEQLAEAGYDKNDVSLSPKVVRKWFEIRGEPLTEEEMNRLLSTKENESLDN